MWLSRFISKFAQDFFVCLIYLLQLLGPKAANKWYFLRSSLLLPSSAQALSSVSHSLPFFHRIQPPHNMCGCSESTFEASLKFAQDFFVYRVDLLHSLWPKAVSANNWLCRLTQYQLDCSPACNSDQSYQVWLEAAMSTTALPNFIIIIIIILIIISFSTL